MESIYEWARAEAEGRDDCSALIEMWIAENSGEWTDRGTWLSEEKVERIARDLISDREWCADELEQMEGITEARIKKVLGRAKLLPDEQEFLLQKKLERIFEEPDEEDAVFLTELKEPDSPTVWLAYTVSGGSWGRVQFEFHGAFLNRNRAISYMKSFGHCDLV